MIALSKRPQRIPTPRLTLRALSEGDVPALARILRSEPVARTYMLPDLSAAGAAEALAERLVRLSRSDAHFLYGAYLGENVIGFLNDVETTEDAVELGYAVAPEYWNRGYATEMLTAAIAALHGLGFAAVRAGCFEENAASRRVMEKSGMLPMDRTGEIAYHGCVHRCRYCEARKNLKK